MSTHACTQHAYLNVHFSVPGIYNVMLHSTYIVHLHVHESMYPHNIKLHTYIY